MKKSMQAAAHCKRVVPAARAISAHLAAALLLIAGSAVAVAAEPTLSVTQSQPLPTPDSAAAGKQGKKAEPVYHLLGFNLRGTTRVDTDALVASLPQHEGDVITNAEIRQNADKIRQALQASHVHGNITTMILVRHGPGHHVWVMWDLQPNDALLYVPMNGQRHFASQTFSGNVRLSTDALIAATGLHAGDKMPDGRVGDARTGIEQAYDKAMPGAAVQVAGKITMKKDSSVMVDWKIKETSLVGTTK
jgi:outer membrane protein assembly factor BamA